MCTNITTKFDLELSSLLIENIENKDTLDQLLLNGANINTQNEIGWCVLFEFIHLHMNNNLYEYHKQGMNINTRDAKGRNALFWAISSSNMEAVKILLSLGISLVIDTKNKMHAFQYVIYKNNLLLLEVLVNNGVNINEKDSVLSTPLIYAVMYSKSEIVNYLIENGSNRFYVDSFGNSAYSLAQELKVESIIQKLEG